MVVAKPSSVLKLLKLVATRLLTGEPLLRRGDGSVRQIQIDGDSEAVRIEIQRVVAGPHRRAYQRQMSHVPKAEEVVEVRTARPRLLNALK